MTLRIQHFERVTFDAASSLIDALSKMDDLQHINTFHLVQDHLIKHALQLVEALDAQSPNRRRPLPSQLELPFQKPNPPAA